MTEDNVWLTPEQCLDTYDSDNSTNTWEELAKIKKANIGAYNRTVWQNVDSTTSVGPDIPVINEENLNQIELGILNLTSFTLNEENGYNYNMAKIQSIVDALKKSIDSLKSFIDTENATQDTNLQNHIEDFKGTLGTNNGDRVFGTAVGQSTILDTFGRNSDGSCHYNKTDSVAKEISDLSTELKGMISYEAKTRSDADDALGTRISDEEDARKSADKTLTEDIQQEVNDRKNAITNLNTSLSASIATEATTREEEDSKLKESLTLAITTETNDRKTADNNILALIGVPEEETQTDYTVHKDIRGVEGELESFASDIKKALGTVDNELVFNEEQSVHKTILDLDNKLTDTIGESTSTDSNTVYGHINNNIEKVSEDAYEALENLFNHFKGKLEEVYSDIGESTSKDSNTVYGYVNNSIDTVSDAFETNLSTVEKKFDDKFNTFTLDDVHDTEQEEIVLDAGTSIGYT